MGNEFFFPAIIEREDGGQIRATAAIRLASLQSVRLRKSVFAWEEEKTPSPYSLHRPLLQALADWPENVTISLNLLTLPVPEYPLSGKIETAILVTVMSGNRQEAIADLLGRTANLFSLLTTFLDKAEFEMITPAEQYEIERWMQPFSPASVYAIDRYRDTFVLALDPKEYSGGNHPIGFLSSAQDKKSSRGAPSIPYLFPWFQGVPCDLATVADALLFHPSPLWLQCRLRPARMGKEELAELEKSLTVCEELLGRDQSAQSILSQQAQALRKALSERMWQQNRQVFRGGVFMCSESPLDEALVAAVAEVISPVPETDAQSHLSVKGGVSVNSLPAAAFLDPDYFSPSGIMTVEEASCAFRIPYPGAADPPGFPIKSFRTGLVASSILQETTPDMILLGHNRHRGHINPVRVSDEDRFRHMVVMGQTGTGKSVFLEGLAISDIIRGKGICFIDFHGDSIEKILQHYPEERADDLVLLDFLDREKVVPFNILACRDDEERDKIIDDLYGWISLNYNLSIAGGPVFEQYFRSFTRMLMAQELRSHFQPTIADFSRLFVDSDFRGFCMRKIQDEDVRRSVSQAIAARGEGDIDNMAPYVASKLNRFVLDKGLQLMTGQEAMSLDFQDFLNNGKVVLINLGRGRFGDTISGLLASQIVGRFQNAAMKRIDMKPDERREFFLIIDEFQNCTTEPFIAMLAEARKFKMGLVLANQYADQLERRRTESGDSVLKAVLGNVGATVCFRLGVNDAKTMGDVFYPTFSSEDLVNLPLGNCYINLKTSRSNPTSFSLETTYVERQERSSHVARLREISNRKYTISVEAARCNLLKHNEAMENLTKNSDDD